MKPFPSLLVKRLSLIGFVLLLCCFHSCEKFKVRISDNQLSSLLQNSSTKVKSQYLRTSQHTIRYITIGNSSKPPLLLLHGSPSSLAGWKQLLLDTSFTNNYYLIAIDRPGYGYSNFGNIENNIATQAQLVNTVLDSISLKNKITILGSSYGGPVAAAAVMQHPNRFEKLLLLSASVKPDAEKVYFISYFMAAPIIKYLFPAIFSMASIEKLGHSTQLKSLTEWQKINCSVVIIHGDKDNLIYYENALYAQQQLKNASSLITVTLHNKGHALIFTEPAFLKKILRLYL